MEADTKVKLARAGIPVVENLAYLDTGSVGPVSKIYAETLAACTAEDLGMGRARRQRFDRIDQARARLIDAISSLLGAEPDRIELTQGTTDAIRTLLARYPWKPKDEIVSTQLEFPRCTDAIHELSEVREVSLRIAAVPETNVDDLLWLEQCITPRTRLIALSGVAYTTGQRLPLDAIGRFAAARGIHTLVDGAQLVGAGKLDLSETPIDFLAMPLQKWLCGPEGLGALFARAGTVGPYPPGRSVHGWAILEAAADHLAWLRETFGWQWIQQRTRHLSEYARDALGHLGSIHLVTPEAHGGLVAVQTRPDESRRIAHRLRDRDLVVRHRPELDLFRISTAFFTTEDEIDRFVAALQ